jgi:hypothetical protein
MVASSVGTQYNTVTPVCSKKSASSAPRRRESVDPTTRVAPTDQVGQISSIEKSKEIVIPWYTRSVGRTSYTLGTTSRKLQMLDCATSTPLGRPLDPDV